MSNQNEWKIIIDSWNSKDIQSTIIEPLKFVTDKKFKPVPYAGQFFGLIYAFASTIYNNAYGYDNLTRAVYASYVDKMPNTYDKGAEQQELFKKILERMPDSFKNPVISCGYLSCKENTDLSLKQANEFLDFLTSKTFNDIMREIRRDDRG